MFSLLTLKFLSIVEMQISFHENLDGENFLH